MAIRVSPADNSGTCSVIETKLDISIRRSALGDINRFCEVANDAAGRGWDGRVTFSGLQILPGLRMQIVGTAYPGTDRRSFQINPQRTARLNRMAMFCHHARDIR